MRQHNYTLKITVAGICVAINVAGSFLASSLRLPIYLDSIGTILAAFLMGPLFGMAVGCLGNAASGILFDVYSLYFMPVAIVLGLTAGLLYTKTRFMKKFKWLPLGILLLIIPESIVGALINTIFFGGITASGSSIIVILLRKLGLSTVESAFIMQILSDYLDRLISVLLATVVIFRLNRNFLNKLKGGHTHEQI